MTRLRSSPASKRALNLTVRQAMILSALCAATVGCALTRSVNANEIPGKYVADFSAGRISLELRLDGSYTQIITMDAGRVIQHEGRWMFRKGKRSDVHLDDALVVDEVLLQDSQQLPRMVWDLPVRREWGRVTLLARANGDVVFEHVP